MIKRFVISVVIALLVFIITPIPYRRYAGLVSGFMIGLAISYVSKNK